MAESKTALMAALFGNAALAVMKGVAAASTGSAAMLAETFHSVADTGNQALLFLGMRLWSYAVLAAGFGFESVSLCVALRALRKAMDKKSLGGYWRDNRDPTLPTVVLEDTAALVSLGAAATGIWLSQVTGSPVWDAGASAVIGLLLVGVAVVLALENYSLLIGEAAPATVEARIRRLVREDEDVVDVIDLRTMHMGPEDILVALGVKFRPSLTTAQIEAAVVRLQSAIRKALDGATNGSLILIEPTRPGAKQGDRAA